MEIDPSQILPPLPDERLVTPHNFTPVQRSQLIDHSAGRNLVDLAHLNQPQPTLRHGVESRREIHVVVCCKFRFQITDPRHLAHIHDEEVNVERVRRESGDEAPGRLSVAAEHVEGVVGDDDAVGDAVFQGGEGNEGPRPRLEKKIFEAMLDVV